MKHALLALSCMILLSGCGMDMNSLLTFDKSPDDSDVAVAEAPQAQAQPQPVTAAAAPNDAFCRAVATQDATSNGFDPATQSRVAVRSYTQCMTLSAR